MALTSCSWRISPLAVLPAFGLGITGLVALIAASFMPAKTPKGSQEAARWRAFRTYLQNIKAYTDLKQASDQFEKYIAYAIAFGLDHQWLREFAPVLTSVPTWYYPTYLGGPWHGGYRGFRGGAQPVGLNLSGPGGLNQMNESLSQGLNAMSAGLTKMLNDASSVMTSHPSSSGGGGFSGGGSSGGGSSGGGSAGFG